mgnify:CR=1 FL=1
MHISRHETELHSDKGVQFISIMLSPRHERDQEENRLKDASRRLVYKNIANGMKSEFWDPKEVTANNATSILVITKGFHMLGHCLKLRGLVSIGLISMSMVPSGVPIVKVRPHLLEITRIIYKHCMLCRWL